MRLAKSIEKSDLHDKEALHEFKYEQIAEAFCSHRFVETFPYMDDEVKWNMIDPALNQAVT